MDLRYTSYGWSMEFGTSQGSVAVEDTSQRALWVTMGGQWILVPRNNFLVPNQPPKDDWYRYRYRYKCCESDKKAATD